MATRNFGYTRIIRSVRVGPECAPIYSAEVLRELPLLQKEYTLPDVFQAMRKANIPRKQWEELIITMRTRGELEERGRPYYFVVPARVKLKAAFSRL